MTQRGLLNIAALFLLFAAVYAVTSSLRKQTVTPSTSNALQTEPADVPIEDMPDGKPAVRDARGALVPIDSYKRIIAGSVTSTEVIAELIEDERIIAFSDYANPGGVWKYAHKPRVEQINDVESILTLDPDIVFYNGPLSAEPLARFRENGVQTFDLGAMRGLESYLEEAHTILTVLNEADRFHDYNYRVSRRAQSVQCHAIESPQEAMYVGIIASTLFGGTTGTSYADVIRLAGLKDAAADTFDGWPQYSTEDILAVNPAWIITPSGEGKNLCEYGSLSNLQACANGRERIIEVPGELLGGAGTSIITAASMTFDQVYGPCAPHDVDAKDATDTAPTP